MAMTRCPDCERRISAQAEACPGCGRRLRAARPGATTGMGAVLLVLALLAALPVAALANYVTGGNVLAAGVALVAPVVAALVFASRRR